MQRKQQNTSRKGRRKGGRGGVNPRRLNQDTGGQAVSVNIPPRNYLATHVAGLTPTLRRTLVWAYDNFTPSASGVMTECLVAKLNSPYDPDNAVGGASATGFAKYMAFYSKCFVLAARIKVHYVACASNGDQPPLAPGTAGVTITTTTGALGSIAAQIEAGLCVFKRTGYSQNTGVLDIGVDVGKFLNKPDVLDDPQLFCTNAADPTQLIVAHVWIQNDSTVSAINLKCIHEIEFDCVFTDPITFT